MQRRDPHLRSFADFWETKLDRSQACARAALYAHWAPDAALADRRRVRAWSSDMYAGPIPAATLDPTEVLGLVAEMIGASKHAGHDTDGVLSALIPVGVHRLWCAELVAVPCPAGWPTIDGVPVEARDWLRPPVGWEVGDPVSEETSDLVQIWASGVEWPVVERYVLGEGYGSAESIYVRLRHEGWSVEHARIASTLLAVEW
jgi:hypothetical protein